MELEIIKFDALLLFSLSLKAQHPYFIYSFIAFLGATSCSFRPILGFGCTEKLYRLT